MNPLDKHTPIPLSPRNDAEPRWVCVLLTVAALFACEVAGAVEFGFYAGATSGVAVVDRPGGPSADALPGARSLTRGGERLTASTLYGGYRFSHGFAVEAARTSFGSGVTTEEDALRENSPAEYVSAWSVAGVGTLELTDTVSLFGKLGMTFSPDTTNSGFNTEAPARPGKVYGFGISYQASANLELRAQSERFTGLGQTPGGELQASALTFGARLRF